MGQTRKNILSNRNKYFSKISLDKYNYPIYIGYTKGKLL
jgi:hypothetical protein